MVAKPIHLDLRKEEGLTIHWSDGTRSAYPVDYLRRMSPSAEARQLREQIAQNPLTVLPAGASVENLTALDAELGGNYAVRIRFSDGHDTGIFQLTLLGQLGQPVSK